MEFENNQPTDDEQRRLAEAKKVTIQPLHTDITPDTIPDAEIAAQSRVQEAAPNTANDTEDTSAAQLLQPSASALDKATDNTPTKGTARPAVLAVVTLLFIAIIGTTIWLWVKSA